MPQDAASEHKWQPVACQHVRQRLSMDSCAQHVAEDMRTHLVLVCVRPGVQDLHGAMMTLIWRRMFVVCIHRELCVRRREMAVVRGLMLVKNR